MAKTVTNMWGLPNLMLPVVDEARAGTAYDRADFSVTRVVRPPRITQLEKRHKDELVTDAIDNWNAFIGKALHNRIEETLRKDEDYLIEYSFVVEEQGKRIGATIDAYHKPTKTLIDHKTMQTTQLGLELKDDYVAQLNVYAYLLEREGIAKVDNIALNVIYVDWRKAATKYATADKYPPAPSSWITVPRWSKEEAEKYFKDQVAKQIAAENLPDDKLPECPVKDTWEAPAKYAIFKHGGVKAIRLVDTEAEVEDYARWRGLKSGTYYTEYRPATRRRCAEYCDAAPFCNQYANWLIGQENAKEKHNGPACSSEVPF